MNNTDINLYQKIGNTISRTDGTRKLTIKGKTQSYPVYQIPLDLLVYNRRNGRIISSMNRFESDGNDVSVLSKEEYNKVIQQFIIDSNKSALDKTKKNIELFGQRLPGVVLNDGTVVDGNRRFTCMRLLKEEGHTVFFEAVILDPSEGLSDIDIKRLELNLQHAEERPVDYNAIDNLVDVYKDIEENKFFSVEEYAKNTNKKTAEIKKMLKKANLMIEFLKFINADGKYYVARDMELDGPLQEIMLILGKEKDEEEAERVKTTLFTALSISKDGDLTRHIRKIGKEILQSENREEFLEEYEDIVEDVYDAFQGKEEVTSAVVREVNKELSGIREEAASLVTRRVDETILTKVKMKPIDSLNTALKTMEKIDTGQLSYMDDKTREEFRRLIEQMRSELNDYETRL